MIRRLVRLLRPGLGILHQHEPTDLGTVGRASAALPPPAPPRIGVVTPSLNCGPYIARAVASVLDQNYPLLSYVVQDGGSNDSTRAELSRFDGQIEVVVEPDDGQAAALNTAFGHLTVDIMCSLNADDILLPGALATVASFFERHPKVDVVYGHRIVIDEHDREIGRWVLPRHDAESVRWVSFVPSETMFWRRSAWEAIGGRFDESLQFALDWDLVLRFQRAGLTIARIPRFLGAFRVRPGQKLATRTVEAVHEAASLRTREHGRQVPHAEALANIWPYVARHLIVDRLHRIGILRY